MTIQLDENTRGIWYCSTIPEEQDFLLTLNRIAEEQHEIIYRFRYYNSNDPFDEKDKKSWFSGEIKGRSEEEVIAVIRDQLMPIIAFRNDGKFTELLRGDRSFQEFIDEFMEQDFVHTKSVH